ncbi:hypothetical protein [Actinomadura litoris]|uniref:Uncharacterized protein n=1 Tax=Actinomadura litoris TaxID=2678616 RepID=A0A7K1KWL1_9ACTN|nr:hypothetical protein [Actinomadura litoris]MUN36539.1 hypothetical protein [Actinomadura litoris]
MSPVKDDQERIDVYGDEVVYVAVHRPTGRTLATFHPGEDEGWWRVSTRGRVRELWVRPGKPEPWREIVERVPAGQ